MLETYLISFTAQLAETEHEAGQPTVRIIPRPQGTAGDDYNLQRAMGLGNQPQLYADIRVSYIWHENLSDYELPDLDLLERSALARDRCTS